MEFQLTYNDDTTTRRAAHEIEKKEKQKISKL